MQGAGFREKIRSWVFGHGNPELSQSGDVTWVACSLIYGVLGRELDWRYLRDGGWFSGPGQGLGFIFRRENLKVFISHEPGG